MNKIQNLIVDKMNESQEADVKFTWANIPITLKHFWADHFRELEKKEKKKIGKFLI